MWGGVPRGGSFPTMPFKLFLFPPPRGEYARGFPWPPPAPGPLTQFPGPIPNLKTPPHLPPKGVGPSPLLSPLTGVLGPLVWLRTATHSPFCVLWIPTSSRQWTFNRKTPLFLQIQDLFPALSAFVDRFFPLTPSLQT